jgi:ferredoxin-nitrate reductase
LPAAQWGEKTGTMTNSERTVTLCPQFRHRPGEAKPDWEIFAEIGRRLGYVEQFNFEDSAAVHREFVQLTSNRPCEMTGIDYTRLQQDGPMQWPCPLTSFGGQGEVGSRKSEVGSMGQGGQGGQGREGENSGILSNLFKGQENNSKAKRLYTNWRFNTPDGRAKFAAYHSKGLAEPPDEQYPLVLTTGRLYGHWHTQTRTGRIEKITKMHPNPFIEIHPRDAEKLGIKEQELVEVRSRRGSARFPAKITTAIAPGTVFVPMHWGALWADNAEANSLTHPEACPDSLEPELKACAVQLIPISAISAQSNEQSLSIPEFASTHN